MAKKAENDKTLEQVLADIEKQFGKGSIMKLGEESHNEIDVVSSGSLTLDIALGVGGYPKGRIIEIYGPESSGKTTFALHAIAEVQKAGGKAGGKNRADGACLHHGACELHLPHRRNQPCLSGAAFPTSAHQPVGPFSAVLPGGQLPVCEPGSRRSNVVLPSSGAAFLPRNDFELYQRKPL